MANATSPGAPGRYRLVIAAWAASAYVLRFVSSWVFLTLTPDRRFDPHGFGLLGDAIQLSAMALPLLGLLAWVLRRRLAWRGLFAPASSFVWTALSIALLLLVGAPTLGQVWTVVLLPLTVSWPVLGSAALWFIKVAVLRALSVSPRAAAGG